MNAAGRSSLLAEPVSMSEPGQPAACCVVLTDAGWRLAWVVGLLKTPFGPIFPKVRDATRASIALNAR